MENTNTTEKTVTLTQEEAEFVFELIMLVGNAYPQKKEDKEFYGKIGALINKCL